VLDLFLAQDEENSDDEPLNKTTEEGVAKSGGYSKVSKLPPKHRPKGVPNRADRSAGANQLARWEWGQALADRAQLGAEFLLVVRNLNPWDLPGALQPYAVAVCLWVEPTLPELYEEVRSRVEDVRVRVRNEIRI
jgi:hypothetical protein